MVNPADSATVATPQSQSSLDNQVQAENEHSPLEKTSRVSPQFPTDKKKLQKPAARNPQLQNPTGEMELQELPTQFTLSHEDSIANLRKLSDAFTAFQRCFTELHKHVDSIRTSIDTLLPPNTTNTAPVATSSPPVPASERSSEFDPSKEGEEGGEEKENDGKSSHYSELENICQSMCGRSLKKYMLTHLSDINGLREQVPKALRLASDPARLALDGCGKFFHQGSKAYIEGSHMVTAREASVLVLECYLLMGVDKGVEIDISVKEEAEQAALHWRKRIISEGGVINASEMDARGLLMLIGCFGIPTGFPNADIVDLFRASNPKEISGALRRSNVLAPKIPGIIERLLKGKKEVDAVNIACTFGIEDRFNVQGLLENFLQRTKMAAKQSEGSLVLQNDAKGKQLSALKSVVKCLKSNNIEPTKLLSGLHIDDEINNLEKEIAELNKQVGASGAAQKRRFVETESSGQFSNKDVKRLHIPPQWTQHQRVVNHLDSNVTLLRGGTAGHIYGHSVSPSVLHGHIAGPRHENVVGPVVGTVLGAGLSADMNTVRLGGSYTNGQLYGWRSDATVYDRLASQSHNYRQSVHLEGSAGLPNTQSGDAYIPPPSGFSNAIPSDIAGRGSASDIYQVADTIAANALYRSSGSRAVDAVPSIGSSYSYWLG